MCLSGLYRAASALAVYASQPRLATAPRKTRLQPVANPCCAGLVTRRAPREVSDTTWLPPHPSFAWRNIHHISSRQSVEGSCFPPGHPWAFGRAGGRPRGVRLLRPSTTVCGFRPSAQRIRPAGGSAQIRPA